MELLTALITWTISLIQAYGWFSVFMVVILEEVLVPIPSVLVLMGAGFILIPAELAFWDAAREVLLVIVLPASIASTIGSFFMYGIGYFGGKPVITKFQKFLGVNWDEITKMEKKFEKTNKTWVTIAVLRAVPFFPIAVVSLTSGVLRLSWKKYAIATFFGSLPRTFALGLIGWQIGASYATVADQLGLVEDVIYVIIGIAVIYLIYRFRHKIIKSKP